MPFGCFGKRKKKEKCNGEDGANAVPGTAAAAAASASAPTKADDDGADAPESVIAVRAQSLHASAPGGNIQKSATLARYDFLRKSDYVNSADRWAALKEQYLVPKMTQSQYGEQLALPPPPPPAAVNGPMVRTPGRTAQSLPRQFSPPSTVVSVVKFSQWFYERQVKEEETRREALEREEKSRRFMEGCTEHELEEAAAKIQAGFKGYQTRKRLHEHLQQRQQTEHPEADDDHEPDHHEPGHHEPGHPDTDSLQMEEAAAKIQAGFRGYQTRKHLAGARQHADDEQHHEHPEQHNDQHDEHHPGDDLSDSDPLMNAAATKIQAGFKGMQARKEVREMRKHLEEEEEEGHHEKHNAEDHGDHPHDNQEHSAEEMRAAAVKIQAGFKGYKTRKEMGKLHDHHSEHPEQHEQHPEQHGAQS